MSLSANEMSNWNFVVPQKSLKIAFWSPKPFPSPPITSTQIRSPQKTQEASWLCHATTCIDGQRAEKSHPYPKLVVGIFVFFAKDVLEISLMDCIQWLLPLCGAHPIHQTKQQIQFRECCRTSFPLLKSTENRNPRAWELIKNTSDSHAKHLQIDSSENDV